MERTLKTYLGGALLTKKTVAINNSKSNMRFSFAKDDRFKDTKQLNNNHAYNVPEQFDTSGRTSRNHILEVGFGMSMPDRFDYAE